MQLQNFFTVQNITGIIALSAIVSTLLSTLITGILNLVSQKMIHKHELNMKYWETYYNDSSQTFSNLLNYIGKLLANSYTDIDILNVMSLIYQSYIYADKELSTILDTFYTKLEAWNNDINNQTLLDDCQKYVIVLAHDINRILTNYSNPRYFKKPKWNILYLLRLWCQKDTEL